MMTLREVIGNVAYHGIRGSYYFGEVLGLATTVDGVIKRNFTEIVSGSAAYALFRLLNNSKLVDTLQQIITHKELTDKL